MTIEHAIELIKREIQTRRDCPEEYDPDMTRALETLVIARYDEGIWRERVGMAEAQAKEIGAENLRLCEELLSMTADRQIALNQLGKAREALTAIANGTEDKVYPFRAMSHVEMKRVARFALSDEGSK